MPPASVQGRGMAVRLKASDHTDLLFMVVYMPPRVSGARTARYEATVRELLRWMTKVFAALPGRTLPVVGVDLNDGLQPSSGSAAVGPLARDASHFAGGELHAMLDTLRYVAVNTYRDAAGLPTLYGKDYASQIGFLLITGAVVDIVMSCVVDHRLGRALQAIPDRRPRDHVPLRLRMIYSMEHDCGAAGMDKRKWDYDKLMECVKYGDGRRQFLRDAQEALAFADESIASVAERPLPDEHWDLVARTLSDAAFRHF